MHRKHTVCLMELEHRICDAASTSSRAAARRPVEPDSYSGWTWTVRTDRPVAEACRYRTNRGESAAALCAGRLRADSEREAGRQPAPNEASMRRAGGGVDLAASGSAAARLRETVAAAAGAEGRGAWDHRLDHPRNRQTELRKVATLPARLTPAIPPDSRISTRRLSRSVRDMETAWTTSCGTTLSDPCARSVGDRALCGRVALASCGVHADGPHAAAPGRGLSRGQRGQGRPACAACSFTTGAGAA